MSLTPPDVRTREFYRKLPMIPWSERPGGCSGCPFSKQKVGSRGPEDSPFVIVGESPGPDEIATGYPFVGPSGEMLEDVLRDAGLYDAGVEPYITNALQCLPRDKTVPGMQPAVHSCQNRLYAELAKYPRKVILVLGAAASWSLTNDWRLKITQDRGRLYTHPLAEIGVVTAVHPAFLMRTGAAFLPWKKDVTYAVDLFLGRENPDPDRWNVPTWSVVEGREAYMRLVGRMANAKEIAADTETGGHDQYGNSYGLDWQRGYILSLSIASDLDNGTHVDIIPGDLLWECEDLTHQLMGNQAEWIWQNGKFDIKWYRHEGVHEARVDHDTMMLSYALNENKGHDLDTIAWDHIRAPKHKDAVDQWFTNHGIPRARRDYAMLPRMELMYPYQAYDTSKTFQAFQVLKEKVYSDPKLKRLYTELLIPGTEFLTRIEMKGLTLDPERVQENMQVLNERLAVAAEKIQVYAREHLGHEININSPIQLKTLLYDKMMLGPRGSSTDEKHLIEIQRKHDHPIAGYLLEWREIAKQRNTYVKPALDRWEPKSSGSKKLHFKRGWIGTDGRVHCDYGLHKTTTGRLGSSDPNMQNIPRDPQIRGQFVAAEGRVLIECDLNQAELRVLALMSGDPTLLEIYLKNEVSIHHITSVAMFGENYDDDQKMRAKAVNFGIVYGREPPSIAQEFDISVKEAAEYIRIWMARFPKAGEFITQLRRYPHDQKNMVNAFGRKKRWGLVAWDNVKTLENEAANWPMQSTAHDITLRSGIIVQQPLKEQWDIDIVNEIHDALYLEAPDDPEIYIPATRYVKQVMQDVPRQYGLTRVPFLAESKMGTRWGRDYMHELET